MISDSYIEQNQGMHQSEDFGAQSWKWAAQASTLIHQHDCRTILDYGCGKGTFKKHLSHPVHEYDPAIPGKEALPAPADFVICNDVLEHIEPELVEHVLDHLRSVTLKVALIVISTKLSICHTLPDGRNPHLSVHGKNWWQTRLLKRYTQVTETEAQRTQEYACVCLA